MSFRLLPFLALLSSAAAFAQFPVRWDFNAAPVNTTFTPSGSLIDQNIAGTSLTDTPGVAEDDWKLHVWETGTPVEWGVEAVAGEAGNRAIFRRIYVAEAWYGGGIFGPWVTIPNFPSKDLSKYQIKVRWRAESTTTFGPIGVTLVEATPTGGGFASRYNLAEFRIGEDWSEEVFNVGTDMNSFAPGTDGLETVPPLNDGDRLQVIFFIRGNLTADDPDLPENGWPTNDFLGEEYIWAVFVDYVEISYVGGSSVPVNPWAEVPAVGGYKKTSVGGNLRVGTFWDAQWPNFYASGLRHNASNPGAGYFQYAQAVANGFHAVYSAEWKQFVFINPAANGIIYVPASQGPGIWVGGAGAGYRPGPGGQ